MDIFADSVVLAENNATKWTRLEPGVRSARAEECHTGKAVAPGEEFDYLSPPGLFFGTADCNGRALRIGGHHSEERPEWMGGNSMEILLFYPSRRDVCKWLPEFALIRILFRKVSYPTWEVSSAVVADLHRRRMTLGPTFSRSGRRKDKKTTIKAHQHHSDSTSEESVPCLRRRTVEPLLCRHSFVDC